MNRFKSAIVFLIGFSVLLTLWAGCIYYFKIPAYFIPTPQAVAQSLWTGLIGGTFYTHIASTISATAIGYAIGSAVAILTGMLFAEAPWLERLANPYIVALQAIPKVALAPLIIVWCGYGITSKIVMVALICFFPVFVNVIVGIKATSQDLLMLFRACSASRWHTLVHAKLPSAAGTIFAGLQVSIVFALIGTVVSEFVAAAEGLGTLINASLTTMDTATMFAAIFVLAAFGIAGSELVRIAHRRVIFWEGDRGGAIKG